MSESDPIEFRPRRSVPTGAEISLFGTQPNAGSERRRTEIRFDRRELDQILRIYGHHVASGEWRDYAIDHLADRAVFSVFRRSSEMPLYRIEKDPKRARRQGAYAVISAAGAILKRGHDLTQVLKVFEKRRLTVVSD